ncbi:MAG: J domain-containing protein, partial [Armatimonadetes bacterium]|nr:J domain-containing protein [Armatimonadota bacterium]
ARDDPEAEERFKLLTEAYRVLSDPELRARYDLTGQVDQAVFAYDDMPFADLFDLVDSFFGFGSRQRRQASVSRGNDVEVAIGITLRDVLGGATRTVRYERLVPCDDCDGTGSQSRARPQTCGTCQGHGRVRYVRTHFFAELSTVTECPKCGGRGTVIADPCPRCRGRGVRRGMEEVSITIPAGVEDGQVLRLAGYGDFPADGRGSPGDLLVLVRIQPDDVFRRNGPHLEAELVVNPAQAALGDRVIVEGLDGPLEVQVEPGTQPDDVIVVRGAGLPLNGQNSRRGDLRLHVRVAIPRPRSRRERELLEELKRIWQDH